MIAESTTRRVLRYLLASGARTAGEIGGAVISSRRGRIASASGGGDYAAQMLLGRLQRRGLVHGSAPGDGGATRWAITAQGRTWLR